MHMWIISHILLIFWFNLIIAYFYKNGLRLEGKGGLRWGTKKIEKYGRLEHWKIFPNNIILFMKS